MLLFNSPQLFNAVFSVLSFYLPRSVVYDIYITFVLPFYWSFSDDVPKSEVLATIHIVFFFRDCSGKLVIAPHQGGKKRRNSHSYRKNALHRTALDNIIYKVIAEMIFFASSGPDVNWSLVAFLALSLLTRTFPVLRAKGEWRVQSAPQERAIVFVFGLRKWGRVLFSSKH